jgi:hypothetical protein
VDYDEMIHRQIAREEMGVEVAKELIEILLQIFPWQMGDGEGGGLHLLIDQLASEKGLPVRKSLYNR